VSQALNTLRSENFKKFESDQTKSLRLKLIEQMESDRSSLEKSMISELVDKLTECGKLLLKTSGAKDIDGILKALTDLRAYAHKSGNEFRDLYSYDSELTTAIEITSSFQDYIVLKNESRFQDALYKIENILSNAARSPHFISRSEFTPLKSELLSKIESVKDEKQNPSQSESGNQLKSALTLLGKVKVFSDVEPAIIGILAMKMNARNPDEFKLRELQSVLTRLLNAIQLLQKGDFSECLTSNGAGYSSIPFPNTQFPELRKIWRLIHGEAVPLYLKLPNLKPVSLADFFQKARGVSISDKNWILLQQVLIAERTYMGAESSSSISSDISAVSSLISADNAKKTGQFDVAVSYYLQSTVMVREINILPHLKAALDELEKSHPDEYKKAKVAYLSRSTVGLPVDDSSSNMMR
jgi:hypothetical protein